MYKKRLLTLLCLFILSASFAQTVITTSDSVDYYIQKQRDWEYDNARYARENFLAKLDKIDSDSAFVLNISQMQFREFPDISRFKNIVKINARDNQFTKVNLKRKNLKHVKSINLSENNIKKLKIGIAPKLKYLNISKTEISKLSSKIILSKNIETIVLNHCHVSRLPWWLKYKKSVIEMNFAGNEFLADGKNFRRMRNLELLNITTHSLVSLPQEICQMQNLEKLVVARSGLKTIPKDFDKLSKLEILIFYKCSFDEIPKSCFNLPSLKHLDFYFNNISSIPVEIANCDSLEELFLAFNKISILPDVISQLINLNKLYIHHNNIEFVPSWINTMDSLRVLDMGFNDISELPSLDNLYELESVDFQSNNIEIFPIEWFLMPKLNTIFMFNNPLVFSKKELLIFNKSKQSFYNCGGKLFVGETEGFASNMKIIKN